MRDEIKGERFVRHYDSLDDLAGQVEQTGPYRHGRAIRLDESVDFWNNVTAREAIEMTRQGWAEQLPAVLAVVESAIELAEKEHMMDTFEMTWAVAGDEVDIGRYLTGEPECMIAFPLSKTSKVGRVITFVANASYSAAIKPDTVIRRGQLMVALALALERLGHSVVIYSNIAYGDMHGGVRYSDEEFSVRVKGADDTIDPARLMFALAHPAFVRCLLFTAAYNLPDERGRGRRHNSQVGIPLPATKDIYPEGAIILPEIVSNRDVPNADVFLREYLGKLGLLAE
jgi:hypothetical protein